jgi:hypothetical protein
MGNSYGLTLQYYFMKQFIKSERKGEFILKDMFRETFSELLVHFRFNMFMIQFCKRYCAKHIWVLRCGVSFRLVCEKYNNQHNRSLQKKKKEGAKRGRKISRTPIFRTGVLFNEERSRILTDKCT